MSSALCASTPFLNYFKSFWEYTQISFSNHQMMLLIYQGESLIFFAFLVIRSNTNKVSLTINSSNAPTSSIRHSFVI